MARVCGVPGIAMVTSWDGDPFHVIGSLCEGNKSVPGRFPSQKASNAEL